MILKTTKIFIIALLVLVSGFIGIKFDSNTFNSGLSVANQNNSFSLKSKDYKRTKWEGKNLIKKSDFIGRVKLIDTENRSETVHMPLSKDSIGAKQGEKTFSIQDDYKVYKAKIIEEFKHSKGKKKDKNIIEIFDFEIIFSSGNYDNIKYEVGKEYLVYLEYDKDKDMYGIISQIDGVFKLENNILLGMDKKGDFNKHKKFIENNTKK